MPEQAIHSWREAWLSYARREVVTLFFLGFAAGLPYLLVFSTLSAWLRDMGIAHSTIGFFSWVGITFSIKVLWAPIVDRTRIPLLHALGRRRSWMLLAQLCIALSLAGMAITNPIESIAQLALLAVLVAFASATQDIAIDAFRIESADAEYQGAMAAMYIFGYRFALLVSGAGALYIADFHDWQLAYLSMAALMSVGIITVLLIREPERSEQIDPALEERVVQFLSRSAHLPQWYRKALAWLIGALVCPFIDFFSRNGKTALIILLLIGIYKLSDITMGVMANPFYLDLGFSKSEIGSVAKLFGFFMLMGGTALGGILVVRFGLLHPLLLGAVLVASTNLLFALMAVSEPTIVLLAVVISADNVSGGLATAVFIAYLSSLTNTQYTATQYALFSSVMTLPAKFLGGFSGVVVEGVGYAWFFIYASAIGLPAIVLVWWLLRKSAVSGEATTATQE